MEKIRRYIIFYGYVQGVGFRYRARSSAKHYGVTGWVRNCSDGSVEMEAEGTEKDIEDMLLVIEKHPWAHIDNIKMENIPLKHDYDFEII